VPSLGCPHENGKNAAKQRFARFQPFAIALGVRLARIKTQQNALSLAGKNPL